MCNDYRSEGDSAKSDLIGLERGIPISMLKALSSPPPNAAKLVKEMTNVRTEAGCQLAGNTASGRRRWGQELWRLGFPVFFCDEHLPQFHDSNVRHGSRLSSMKIQHGRGAWEIPAREGCREKELTNYASRPSSDPLQVLILEAAYLVHRLQQHSPIQTGQNLRLNCKRQCRIQVRRQCRSEESRRHRRVREMNLTRVKL